MTHACRPRWHLLCCGIVALLLQACAAPPAAGPAHPSSVPTTVLHITGAVERPLRLDLAALQAMPSTDVSASGRRYTGASLWALLAQAGLKGVSANPSATGALYLVATGSDGYKAVLSAGEIDPSYGNRQAIVAYAVDGASLGANGFARLVVAGDARMSRSVSRLATIEVMAPTAPR